MLRSPFTRRVHKITRGGAGPDRMASDARYQTSMKPVRKGRTEEVSEADVLAHLKTATKPLSIREMAYQMGLRHRGR